MAREVIFHDLNCLLLLGTTEDTVGVVWGPCSGTQERALCPAMCASALGGLHLKVLPFVCRKCQHHVGAL